MAQFIWKNGNQGFYRLDRLDDFTRVSTTATKIVFRHSGENGDYDPTAGAFRIVFATTGRTTFRPEDGPDAGKAIVTGGTVTGIRMFNQAGRLILEIKEVGGDLASFEQMWRLGEKNDAMRGLLTGDNSFVGATNGAGPQQDWTGDDITTGAGNDTVSAGGGDDYIKDFGGTDVYKGGAGWDVVSYDEFFWNPRPISAGIVANLARGTVRGPDGNVDTLKGIEGIRGTHLLDRMTGNAGDNDFMGLAGRDVIDGGGGFDSVSYRNDANFGGTAGARVNLARGTARDGFGTVDKLKNIEGAQGTNTRDIFIDNGKGNWFRGRDGNDEFRLTGGNDTAQGDGGADRFVFNGTAIGDNRIVDFNPGEGDRIRIQGVTSFAQLTIEQDGDQAVIIAASGRVRLDGWDADDVTAAAFLF